MFESIRNYFKIYSIYKQIRKAVNNMDILKSRKFWVTIIASLVPVLNSAFGWELDSAKLAEVVIPLLIYVLSIAHIDASMGAEKHIAVKCNEEKPK